MYELVIPGLMRSLGGIRGRVDGVLERQGVSRETWADMPISEREALLRKDRRRRT
jgi:hypothetical protein